MCKFVGRGHLVAELLLLPTFTLTVVVVVVVVVVAAAAPAPASNRVSRYNRRRQKEFFADVFMRAVAFCLPVVVRSVLPCSVRLDSFHSLRPLALLTRSLTHSLARQQAD